jgi:hypothetical protein
MHTSSCCYNAECDNYFGHFHYKQDIIKWSYFDENDLNNWNYFDHK